MACRGHDESVTSANRGNYVEMLELVANYDAGLKEHIEGNSIFRGMSPEIQNELIASVSDYVMTEIKKEVAEAEFIAVIIDAATDRSAKAQMFTVLRYIRKNGGIGERFLHFTNISGDRSAVSQSENAKQVLIDFNYGSKLVVQTYDGASVMTGEHAVLQAKLPEQYKETIFVHCYAHRLSKYSLPL